MIWQEKAVFERDGEEGVRGQPPCNNLLGKRIATPSCLLGYIITGSMPMACHCTVWSRCSSAWGGR